MAQLFPMECADACQRLGIEATDFALVVSVERQEMDLFAREKSSAPNSSAYQFQRTFKISTSRYGVGQQENSNKTPLGLHRIAEKIGGDAPRGSVFRGRVVVGNIADEPNAPIAHRIMWLDGLDEGVNRGGEVDTHSRYVYIHGVGDESRLGQPDSIGCVHLSADDLIPLFDLLPSGTLVWIAER